MASTTTVDPAILVECEKHELIGCTLCSGKESTLLPNDARLVRVDMDADRDLPALKAPGPREDPHVRLAGEVASGYRCGICLLPRKGLGCECNRERVYQDDMAEAASFLTPQITAAMIEEGKGGVPAIKARTFQSIGVAVQRRAMRRVHRSDEERDDERAGLRDELGIESSKARWHQPRTNEASYLPV